MLYAKVVLGLPIEGPFDYFVPKSLDKKVKVGVRVEVGFRTKRMFGYVVKLAKKTNIRKTKPILKVLDGAPILDKNMLLLTKAVSEYYCCCWGEAIETALPEGLRKGKMLPRIDNLRESACDLRKSALKSTFYKDVILVHDLDGKCRWNIYLEQIEETLKNNKSVIILLPNINSVLHTKEIIASRLDASLSILYRKEPRELAEWTKIMKGEANIVIGTRSSVFAPVRNLGLVIIDEEEDSVYKQEQVPHYHSRVVALMRINIEKARLILGSISPSLESFYLSKKNKIEYVSIPKNRNFPEVKIIDMKFEYRGQKIRNIILSKYLEDAISASLNSGEKILLFLNRRGFATIVSCHNCGKVLVCPRCNINLVYHFKEKILNCHYCNFKMQAPQICPDCNCGYIKFAGGGTEKIESELSRIFAQARVKRLEAGENLDFKDADIFIATSSIIKQTRGNFDLVGVLGVDNSLNRVDLRAGEKTFAVLSGLLALTERKLVIQTRLPSHHCFQALIKKDSNIFYDEELRQRKQLNFPPYKHMVLVKLRGKKEDRVRQASFALFERLNKCNKSKSMRIISVHPRQPAKLRGNFYWQLLISSDNVKKASKFLKIHLKDFSRSGIIVTVDVDPL